MVMSRPFRALAAIAGVVWCGALAGSAQRQTVAFRTADACLACHNGLTTPAGEDVSIGSDWRGSMMANSARDPYWLAAVRREAIDHPAAAVAIEDTCATCHMPMARADAVATAPQAGRVFRHFPVESRGTHRDRLAQDGVSCTICHQISDRKLGTPESFSGGFVIDTASASHGASLGTALGPFDVDAGRAAVMESASTFRPAEAPHVRKSELCATCHTLYTRALGPKGEPVGRLPEQVPFLEWRHSAYRDDKSCQACHMPAVERATPVTSVLGTPREGLARHSFRGSNFFVLQMLSRYRRELGVVAQPSELEAAGHRTTALLQSETATVAIERADRSANRLTIDVAVHNLTGHKLPTGFPSRRAWLNVVVRDRNGAIVFESGALGANGRIEGNDNDADPLKYEPHFRDIRRAEDVEIYESIIGDADGRVTTGLLTGTRYLKDNRLLPRGFDKASADADIAVLGDAAGDADFAGGSDRVTYAIDAAADGAPFQVEVALRFQPIGFRWARNLDQYRAMETQRFVGYYNAMAGESAIVLAKATTTVR
jgi:Cytochrome c554 and c-prime